MNFRDFIKQFLKKRSTYKSLNTITIKKQSIIDNFHYFQTYTSSYQIIPVLKSNAYGHGLKQLCSIINSISECRIIAIDSYPEYQLVINHTKKDILLMGETWWENYQLMDCQRTHVSIRNKDTLIALGKTKKPWKIHLFINTGMNREWVSLSLLPSLLESIKWYPWLQVVWVMSHLACADQPDHPLNNKQVTLFHQAVQLIRKANFNPTFIHLEATAWMINQIDTLWVCNTWRLGLWLYGYDPLYTKKDGLSAFGRKLMPAMDIYSTISSIQYIQKGESVWYGANWVGQTNAMVGSFPFGYKEWIERWISWKAWKVQINDDYYEIIWKINMNYSSFKILSLDDQYDQDQNNQNPLAIASKVHIISSNQDDHNTLYKYFDLFDGIVYEWVRRDPSIKRIII